jgi:hypothetical protein
MDMAADIQFIILAQIVMGDGQLIKIWRFLRLGLMSKKRDQRQIPAKNFPHTLDRVEVLLVAKSRQSKIVYQFC